jgi:thioredoxin 1
MTNQGAPYLDQTTFQKDVEKGDGLALIDFTASWCGPCRALAPHVDALSKELEGSVLVAKVDIDANPELAERFGVQAVPTLLIFQAGKVADRIIGALPPHQLRARLEAVRTKTAA